MINALKKALFIFFAAFTFVTALASINSASITADTLEALPHCTHLKIRGTCFWLSPLGVVNTTPYIEQYLPDLVVSVFKKPGDNPWTEVNATLDQAGKVVEQQIIQATAHVPTGFGDHSFNEQHQQNVFFKEADVIGNPGLTVLSNPLFLPSSATPLDPYYQSMLDAILWRGLPVAGVFPPEEAYAWVADVKQHIGTGVMNEGGLYPHEGKIETSNDTMAAEVIAQRATDILTSKNDLVKAHIHQSLSDQCGQHCHASPITLNSSKTEFQPIYPTEKNSCDYFGKSLTTGDNETHKGNYAWIVWRHYKGCRDGNGKFLYKILFN